MENLYCLKFKIPNRLFAGWRLGQRKAFQNLSSQERAVGEATPVTRSVDPHLSAKGGQQWHELKESLCDPLLDRGWTDQHGAWPLPTRASTCWTPIRYQALSKCFQCSQQPQEVCTLSDFTLQTQNLRQEGGSPSMQPGWRHLHHAKHLHREGPARAVSPPSGGSLTQACAHTRRKSTELGQLSAPLPETTGTKTSISVLISVENVP